MTTHWLIQFLIDHPFISFLLSWPVVLTLITLAWLVASSVENSMNLVLRLFNMTCNTFVIAVRGYAPQSIEAQEVEKDQQENEDGQ